MKRGKKVRHDECTKRVKKSTKQMERKIRSPETKEMTPSN